MLVLLFIILNIKTGLSSECDLQKAAKHFNTLQMMNDDMDYDKDPYVSLNQEEREKISQVLQDRDRVCALQFIDQDKQKYILKDFDSKEEAVKNKFFVTHYGPCGLCSNLKNLSVYLQIDLTKPAKKCTIVDFFSRKKAEQCYENKIGLTQKCAKIWNDSAVNTKKECLSICLWVMITFQPDVKHGKLNKCILCDENKSGPIFKYFAGRNRRNSGIESELPRPDEQIRPVDHCSYYHEKKSI